MIGLRRSILLCLFLLLPGVLVADEKPTSPSDERRIALTIDDLPWVMNRNEPPADLDKNYGRLIASLKQANVPAIGFVNDGKLYRGDAFCPERADLLDDWLDAGFELGNHTAWHSDLHEIGIQAYENDIIMGERHLRPLLAKRGLQPRWFRHPFLRTGRSPEDKAAITDFLASHGYRTAPVTINSSEWIYALAYRNALANGGDPVKLANLRNEYIVYMLAKLDYYERRSTVLLGYPVPQILMIHANELNADALADLIAGIRGRGYRFVSLDEAVTDPAYQRSDGYIGELGPSWIHRWARAEHRSSTFFYGDPTTASWVMKLAGVESSAE
ncbi:MAG: polysaccharide deacetylase family protein [Arenimonas sp.]